MHASIHSLWCDIPLFTGITVSWCSGLFLLWKIPFLKKNGRDAAPPPPCTIVIPARDEAHNLPHLLESLADQTVPPGEIIVVDDGSTDNTAEIARRQGARLVTVKNKPDGWTGKTWACYVGARIARHDLLLFCDADTRFSRDGVEKICNAVQRSDGMVTVQPFHCIKKSYEQLSLFFNIVVMMGIGAFTPLGSRVKPTGGFGPCIACGKSLYFKTGGHAAVRGTVLENLALGRLFIAGGLRVRCCGGKGTVTFRMYPGGIRDLIGGWRKGFATGSSRTNPLFLFLSILWLSGACMSCIIPATSAMFHFPSSVVLSVVWYLLFAGQILWMCRRIGSFSTLSALFYPVFLVFFFILYTRSFMDIFILKRIWWKGRTIPVQEKTKNGG